MMVQRFSQKFMPTLKNVYKLSMRNFSNDSPLSLFRQNFTPHTEEQLNLQISQELNASQAYLSMSNFFGRTEISLKGASSFFLAMSCEEREHALELINFQNMRGGRVKMKDIVQPKAEFTSLFMALEESLLIERSNTTALMELVNIAEKDRDIVTVDYITSKFLNEQMSALQIFGNILMRLKRFEQKGLGEYLIDLELQKEYPAKKIELKPSL